MQPGAGGAGPGRGRERLRSRLPALLAPILSLSLAAAIAASVKTPPFRAVTLDGRTYTSYAEPAIKKGYLFLTDERRNFFSLPLETIDWKATREANRTMPQGLLERWHEGPARYLLRAEQVREYRSLADDVQRAAWISRFWSALDPTPVTFFNERRYEYWSRVERANVLFIESTKPGWKTDRGKFYILLGPPDEIESYPSRSGNDARFDPRYVQEDPDYPRFTIPPRGVTRWIYRNPPAARLDPNTIVAFKEDASGEYYLSTDGVDYDRIFRDAVANLSARDLLGRIAGKILPKGGDYEQRAEAIASLSRAGAPPLSALSLMADLGEIQKEALAQDWLQGIVSAREYFGVFPVRSAHHFYRSQEGLTYVEVNLAVDAPVGGRARDEPGGAGGTPPLRLGGRLVSQADPDLRVEFGPEDGFSALPDPGGPAGRWLFQSGAGVPPGLYTLLVAITDTQSGQIGSWREFVEVPDLSAHGLMLSDLVLACRVEPEPGAGGLAYKQPFLHGHLRVIPDVDATYRSGSELAFYYQVYGAEPDPQAGEPSLDLIYRFERLEEEGPVPLGAAVTLEDQHESSQAFALPLKGWPAGSYRLHVQVRDRRTGQMAERAAGFKVE